MERLIINTGLESFVMPDKINQISTNSIEAIKSFDAGNLTLTTKIETLAQICALHTRFITDFMSHAFLLKIDEFTELSTKNEPGDYRIIGEIQSSASTAISYWVTACFNDMEKFRAKLIIARTNYNDTFKKQSLEKHYRKVYSCLTKDLQKN